MDRRSRVRDRQPSIDAVILDMDGVIIDTEPVWHTMDTLVFAELGIELGREQLLATTGRPIGELVPIWRSQVPPPRGDPPAGPSDADVARRITDLVVAHVQAEGEPMPGVIQSLDLLRRLRLSLAIASSSPRRLINTVCARLGLEDVRVRCSADDERHGKPAPDIYLTAARRLSVSPDHCLAIEDSPRGVLAAKAAGMRCIAVPDPLLNRDATFSEADQVIASMRDLDVSLLRALGWDGIG